MTQNQMLLHRPRVPMIVPTVADRALWKLLGYMGNQWTKRDTDPGAWHYHSVMVDFLTTCREFEHGFTVTVR